MSGWLRLDLGFVDFLFFLGQGFSSVDEVGMSEPENHLLKLMRDIGGEIKEIHQQIATLEDDADARSELKSMRADVASDIVGLEKRVSDRMSYLNRAVMEYRSSSVGHSGLMNDFDVRLRRVEQHLKLPPVDSH